MNLYFFLLLTGDFLLIIIIQDQLLLTFHRNRLYITTCCDDPPPPHIHPLLLSILNSGFHTCMMNLLFTRQFCSLLIIIISHIIFSLIANFNIDTFDMHRVFFYMLNIDIACTHCLLCFKECNFQTSDISDLMTSRNNKNNNCKDQCQNYVIV